LASELIGLAEAMLAETIAHVSTRHQFGHPIASFQTVKHRLADVHVAVVAAKAGISTAWSDETPRSATAAKCLAALAHDLASTHSHQVHGGIAFTVEYGFHRWIERGRLLDAVLGSRVELTRNLGQALIADGAVPRTPGLVDLSA
jgi:alkylation response protein AidB-like acyl-CoA dehydrogenase